MRVRRRSIAVVATLLLATATIAAWSLTVGDVALSFREVLTALVGDGDAGAEFVVGTLRLPRVLTGIGVGALFGMSGALFQSVARNPLGSPDVIGFEQGAAAGAVLTITVFHAGTTTVALGAVAGGLVTAVLVYVLALRDGLSASRLVLVGIGIGFTASALVDHLLTRARIHDVQRAVVWLTGSLNNRTWDHVRLAGLAVLVLAPLAVAAQRALDRLELGDDAATALGVRVGRTKLLVLVLGVLLAALAVAAAGPIVFVAFVAAPIARRLTSTSGPCVVPAACVGALLTTAGDLAARRVLAPTELPVGIATAVLGAPYLLWLLTRRDRAGAW